MHQAFLQDILAHPDDDLPRLVYADWLDDNGDFDRAEFIRVQCELARTPIDGERRPELEGRERHLLAGHHKTWAGPLRTWVKRYWFRRGFVEGVKLDADVFLPRADELFRLAPVRQAHLDTLSEDLAASAHLRRLTGLTLTRASHLSALLTSPHLSKLQALGLAGTILRTVNMPALGHTSGLESLTELDLGYTHLNAANVRALAGDSGLRNLRKLRLGGQVVAPRGDRQFREAVALFLDRLEELELRWGGETTDGVLPLNAPARLRVLRLERGTVDLTAPVLSGLAVLSLRRCALNPQALRSLVGGRTLENLRVLDLGDSAIGRPVVETIAASPHLRQLTRLGLAECRVAEALGLLAAADRDLPELAELDLRGNPTTPDCLSQLIASSLREQLTWLDLSATSLNDSAVNVLLSADWPRLTWLDLRNNGLSRASQRALRERFGHAVRYGPTVPKR